MAARILSCQLIVGIEFFRRVYVHGNGLAVFHIHTAAIRVDNEFGIDQMPRILYQPFDTVGFPALLISSKRENQIAVGLVTFFLETNKGGDENRIALLHVLRAASIIKAVFFHELK